jgi:hypothetical protein
MRLENSQSTAKVGGKADIGSALTAEALKATKTIWLLGKHGAGGGTRTRTGFSPQRILSPLRLPFRHPGSNFAKIVKS